MNIFVVTAFPKLLEGPFNESILKRAQEKAIVQIRVIDLRDFTADKHKQVDDYPYGGGPGMILKPEPLFKAVDFIKENENLSCPDIVLMSPRGSRFDQKKARALSQKKDLIFLCGHYKGVDERVREHLATDEISIGDYILTGGELPAMVVIDAVVRLLPGVLGDSDSALSDSFEQGHLDCPYYTRPREFRGMKVPEVLISGHHAEIEKWRKNKALQHTKAQRGDLLSMNNE
ncbi:MAG: tRNA (guanosine(37)-N1)-methyltransferase TrmD [bacterium]